MVNFSNYLSIVCIWYEFSSQFLQKITTISNLFKKKLRNSDLQKKGDFISEKKLKAKN